MLTGLYNLPTGMKRFAFLLIFSTLYFLAFAQSERDWGKYAASLHSASKEYLVDFGSETSRKQILDMGFHILREVAPGWYVVQPVASDVPVKSLHKFRYAQASPEWKIGEGVKEQESIVRTFLIKWEGDLHPEMSVVDEGRGIYAIRTSLSELRQNWLANPLLRFVTVESLSPKVEARVIDMNLNPNRVNKVHHYLPELNAIGDTISVQENLFNASDIDLITRTVPSDLASTVLDPHATEMATIIAGAGNSFITGKGVAQRALVTSSDFINAIPDSDTQYRDRNIYLQNHSYGTSPENFYGVQAQAFDQSAFNNPNLLHVFSSGNQGGVTTTSGPYAGVTGMANLTGNFKMAKNILVVGSVDTTYKSVSFVSKGPAYDGRVKPEVVAYSMFGSSNSAAVVSGITALMQQAYFIEEGQKLPSALAKAILVNTARDVGPSGLDFITGYGSVDAYRSIQAILEGRYISASIAHGEVNEHVINIPEGAVNFKVTLCWTDPSAELGAATALVNDIDLRVSDGSETFLPWVLNAGASTAALTEAATRGEDHINNLEQVTLATTNGTEYTIEVEGFDVTGSQSYHLTYDYQLPESFAWDFPTGSDNMPYNGETVSYFRWNTTYSGSATLSYTTDDGDTWTVLDNSVDLSRGYWRWKSLPQGFFTAKARMQIGEETFESEVFSISRPLRASVGFHCGDSLLLQWPRIVDADGYDLYEMGEGFLELYASTSDTFLLVPQVADLQGSRLALQPRLNGQRLLRAATFDFTQQGVDCYLISFFQNIVLEEGIYLDLRLGTTYGINQIDFYKQMEGEWTSVSTILNPSNTLIQILDNAPNQGPNKHRVVLSMLNGEQIEAETAVGYYMTDRPILVFPNPVSSYDVLTISTKNFNTSQRWFRIYDATGALVMEQIVRGDFITVDMQNFRSGLYFYELISGNQKFTGRVVVQ